MIHSRHLAVAATVLAALLTPGASSAEAMIGGVIGATFSEELGACNKSVQVSNSTLQDTFALSLSAPCTAGSAGGDLRGSTVTGSVGMRLFAQGTGSASGQVSLLDQWILTPPPGTASGTYAIPVSLHIDGNVSPGTTGFAGSFLDYSIGLMDIHSSLPDARLDSNGSVRSTGTFSNTVSGDVNIRYFGPTSSVLATFELGIVLTTNQMFDGTVDFYNSAFVALALPAGWTAVTSSGLAVSPVPESGTAGLMLLGLAGVWLRRRAAG